MISPSPEKADTTELVERLRARRHPGKWTDTVVYDPLCADAADALSSLQDELKRVNALLTARTTEAASAAAEPKGWLYLERGVWKYTQGPAQPHPGNDYPVEPLFGGGVREQQPPDKPDDRRFYAQPLPNPPAVPASVDDYNTALEEVKRLREARPIAVLPDDWLQHNRMRWSADFDTAILDAMDAVSLIDELLAYRGVERGPSPHDHVLVTCANGHRNWMERGDRDGWRIQEAYCATCREPLHRATR